MAKALHKVQKQISKKRVHKSSNLHENSRDAQRLRRAGGREDKINKLLTAAVRSNEVYVDRVAFFQSAIESSTGPASEEELQVMIASYIGRDDKELAALKAQRRPGRPQTSQEDRLRSRIEDEKREYRAGFWVPDMRDEDGRTRLERWNGEWAGLNALKFVRVVEAGGSRPSSFPPKGLS